jgi:acetyltransferase-like isoleucine patch superfamily enzyme
VGKIAIFGESGHAQDIASLIAANDSQTHIAFIAVKDEPKEVARLAEDGFRFIIGVGDNKIRREIALRHDGLPWISVISAGAHVPKGVFVGNGVFVGFAAYLSYNVSLGNHSIVHCNSVIGHDARLGPFSQVAPGVCVGGNGVNIEEGAFIGTNATILNKRLTIGAWSKVSLSSVVSEDLAPNTLFQTVYKRVTLGLA